MKANLETAYKQFTPHERLALLVEAAARRDHAESDRLWQTAPLVRLQGIHPDVSEKFRELEALASAVVMTLQGLIAAFHAAYSLNMNRDSFARGWLEAGGKAKALVEQQKAQEPEAEEIAEAVFARAREAFTIACAYDEACEQIGFSRDLLVRLQKIGYFSRQGMISLY